MWCFSKVGGFRNELRRNFFFNLKSGTAIEKTSTQQLHFNKVIGKAKMNIIVIVKGMFT